MIFGVLSILFISIHAPRGGSDCAFGDMVATALDFNPRSPRGERPLQKPITLKMLIFQSTLPAGGATREN